MTRSGPDDGACGEDETMEWQADELEMLGPHATEEGRMRSVKPLQRRRSRSDGRSGIPRGFTFAVFAILARSLPSTMAQSCISLHSSTACPAFNASSISTNANMTGLFPFLSSVTDTPSFDSGLLSYISGDFASTKYNTLLGCSDFHSDNTTDFYARYTASVLCNAIVQNSISPCGLSGTAARPLCAESCASYAQSEEDISASNVCGTAGSNALTQIRADFTNCALPADSLTQSCIEAEVNQPKNCGYGPNLSGLCSYCAASSPNATDSCCVFSDTTSRCKGVTLPVVASSALRPITTTSSHIKSSSSPSSSTATSHSSTSPSATSTNSSKGLTGGQVAGIVVGAIFGALALLGLLIFGCLCFKRHRDSSPPTSVFNQPVTARHQPQMSYNDGMRDREDPGMTALPAARVARMAALEDAEDADRRGPSYSSGAAYRRKSASAGSTPDSRGATGTTTAAAAAPKRGGSLSSGSQLAAMAAASGFETSPSSNEYTSPESQAEHSEQLAFFKDYYSQDDIHTGDLVSTLWAYEPRAADEFHLERGDMIKVLGIWDDGWATGVRVRQQAEDWRAPGTMQRDSAQSGPQGAQQQPPQTADDGEVKAFPLVCVCLPQHWRKTIEGESTEGSGPGGYPD